VESVFHRLQVCGRLHVPASTIDVVSNAISKWQLRSGEEGGKAAVLRMLALGYLDKLLVIGNW
jgi:hypothetical protein